MLPRHPPLAWIACPRPAHINQRSYTQRTAQDGRRATQPERQDWHSLIFDIWLTNKNRRKLPRKQSPREQRNPRKRPPLKAHPPSRLKKPPRPPKLPTLLKLLLLLKALPFWLLPAPRRPLLNCSPMIPRARRSSRSRAPKT